jgi:hypothetical protein
VATPNPLGCNCPRLWRRRTRWAATGPRLWRPESAGLELTYACGVPNTNRQLTPNDKRIIEGTNAEGVG